MSSLCLLQGSLDNLDLTLDEAIAAWILLGEIVMWLNHIPLQIYNSSFGNVGHYCPSQFVECLTH